MKLKERIELVCSVRGMENMLKAQERKIKALKVEVGFNDRNINSLLRTYEEEEDVNPHTAPTGNRKNNALFCYNLRKKTGKR